MDVTVGSFNLNNLFGRWNLFAEAPAPRAAPALFKPGSFASRSPVRT